MPICPYCGKFTDHAAPADRCTSIQHPKNKAEWRARVLEEERHEKAERIAGQTVDPDTIPPSWPADAVLAIKGAAYRAALAALTEKENAR